VLKKNEEFDSQCNKYKSLLGSTVGRYDFVCGLWTVFE
jgi:hypothetical protein